MYQNIRLGEYVLLKSFSILFIFKQTYLVKLCPIFDSSASSFLTRYQKILLGGSLRCKKVLKFTCLTVKFHNCYHTNLHTQKVSNHRWTHCRNIESISTYKDQFQASDHKIRASHQMHKVCKVRFDVVCYTFRDIQL